MIMKIDIREHDLFQYCKQTLEKQFLINDVLLVSENLPVGDIIIADNLEEKLIIERKTLADLASSIKDGRYAEQSYRLNGLSHPNHNIIYLIEGDLTLITEKIELVESHRKFMDQTVQTVDHMLYGIRHRIMLEDYLRGNTPNRD